MLAEVVNFIHKMLSNQLFLHLLNSAGTFTVTFIGTKKKVRGEEFKTQFKRIEDDFRKLKTDALQYWSMGRTENDPFLEATIVADLQQIADDLLWLSEEYGIFAEVDLRKFNKKVYNAITKGMDADREPNNKAKLKKIETACAEYTRYLKTKVAAKSRIFPNFFKRRKT